MMRLLAIGYPLPHPDIDNYSALTAPSYFDYETVLVDPRSITEDVRQLLEQEREFEAFDRRPVLNAPSTATAVSAAEQLLRRAEETRRHLERGGLVVVVGRPNATQAGLVGFEGCDRYSWLPAPAGLAWGPPFLRAAEGKNVNIVVDAHPFADVFREHRKEAFYRAVFDDRQSAFRQAGRVLATGGASAPISVEFSVLGGRVVFVPSFGDTVTERHKLAEHIVDACRQLVGAAPREDAPYWTRSMAVPGLEQVEAELEETEAAFKEAEARLEAVRERQRELAAHRELLWQEGMAFDRAVARALALLGFTVASAPGDPLTVESEGKRAFVETGASREQVVEWPYVHLQRRLEDHLLKQGEQLKGIVAVNGRRLFEPMNRQDRFTEPLRIACENYRYTLMTGETLFALVQRALGGADEAALIGMRRRIMSTNGLLSQEVALGDVEEGQESGPIF
jgi:hypothetical protein